MHEVSVPRPVPPKPSRPLIAVVMAAAVIAGTGCRAASWKPPSNWSMFGSSSKATGGLTDAPEYAQGPAKPSATASPYPTTSTPEAYVVGDGGAAAGGPGLAAAAASPSPPTVAPGGSVVYGSTPPAASAALSQERFASLPSGSASSPAAGAYGAQVGPYAPAMQADPAAAPPGYPAAASGGAPPLTGGEDRFGAAVDPLPGGRGGADATPSRFDPGTASDPASQLVADRTPTARTDLTAAAPAAPAAGGWQSPPAAAAAPPGFPDPGQDSRYSAGGSRFSGLGGGAPPPERVDAMVPQQSLPAFATGSATPPPVGSPGPASPATFPAMTAPAMPPAGPPAATPSFGSPPSRRPDPGYRPGGTSSFQPRSGGAAGVQTVGFDAPLAN